MQRLRYRDAGTLLSLLGSAAILRAAPAVPPSPASVAYGEQVKLVSDGSVEESITRQKNLNFSGVRIDGEKSDIALSSLSADQILDAVATKVATPDLDADAIGGLLQLTSRRAFDQTEPTLRGSLAASYDPLVGKPLPEVSVTLGRNFGERQQFGFLTTFEHIEGRDGDENIELTWDASLAELRRFDFSETRDASGETNFNGTLDWKLGENSFAFVRLEAQFARERVLKRSLGYELPGASSPQAASEFLFHGATLRRSVEESRARGRSLTFAAGANHSKGPWRIDVRLTHSGARERIPEQRTYDFAETDLPIILRHSDPGFPSAVSPLESLPGDAARQQLDELQVHRANDRESDDVASIDIVRERTENAKPLLLKFGGKVRRQRTTRDQRHDVFEPAGAGLSVSDVLDRSNSGRIVEGRYSLAGSPNPGALRRLLATQPGRLVLNEAKTRSDTDPANFDVAQRIMASYAMARFRAGATRLLLGARVEHTSSRFGGFEVAFDEQGRYENTRAVSDHSQFTHFFPGVHASREFAKKVTVFASWTRSIRRPDYVDLVPARRISRFDRTIEEGNAALRPELYINYDAAIDYDYRNDGKLSVELFHRDIRDPTLTRRAIVRDGPFLGYERTSPENGGRARVQGIQLTWRQGLAAIADRLEGLDFEINYTQQHSRQSLASRPEESLALVERPAQELAVVLSYDRGPYYIRIDFTRSSRTLESVGLRTGEDVFIPKWHTWDVSVSRQFGKSLRVFLEVENVSATPERAYVGNPSRPHRYEVDLREFRFGIKWTR